MFKLQDCFLPSAVRTNMGNWKQRENYLKKGYKSFMSLTVLSFYETALG
jgi:hypothetical protein